MGVETGWEKFYKAFFFAVASEEPIQRRFCSVVADICDLARDSFPDDETWDRFQLLVSGNTKLTANGDLEAVATATAQIPEEQAATWLRYAFTLFSDLAYAYGRESP